MCNLMSPDLDGTQLPMDIKLEAQSISSALEELKGKDAMNVHYNEISMFDKVSHAPIAEQRPYPEYGIQICGYGYSAQSI